MIQPEYVVVLTTLPADYDAARFASTLVDERLAACVNIYGEMESIYRWKGGLQHDRERQVVIKTTAVRLPDLKTRLGELHPYDVPELLVIPVSEGGDSYLAWVRDSTDAVPQG